MTAPAIALQETVSFSELRKLSGAAAPCITIATALPNPLEVRTRLKNAVHGIEKDLSSTNRGEDISGLIEPIREAADTIETKGLWGRTLLVLRSPDVFQGYWLRDWPREIRSVGPWFQLRALLAAVSREQRFHLLAVSQGRVRLFDSTLFRAEEIKLPAAVPANLHDWLNARQPDHVLDNRSPGGPSTGSMKGVLFGTSTDREKRDEYLKHFFQEIDRGVHAALRDGDAPLLLAGLQQELAVYRRINTYPHLSKKEVHGSPDRLSTQELHERAADLLSQSPSEAARNAITELERRPSSQDFKEISRLAPEGRIEDLLIADDADADPLDPAALETLRHGGRVFVLKPNELPGDARAVAALRH
jgi:hypothetical protein